MEFKKLFDDEILQGTVYEFEDEAYKGKVLIPFKNNSTVMSSSPSVFGVEAKLNLVVQPGIKIVPKTKDNDYKILLNFIPNSLEIKDAESFIIIIKKCISSIKELKNAINEKM